MKSERVLPVLGIVSNVLLLIVVLVAVIDKGKDLDTMRYLLERGQRQDREIESLREQLSASNTEEIPTITTYCQRGEVNGPEAVPLEHPVLEISGRVLSPGFWLELQVNNTWGGKNYILSAFGSATSQYTDVYDGYISSIRGNVDLHVLNSEDRYILRGWRYPYTTGSPSFGPEDLLFETDFKMPDCQAASRLEWSGTFLVFEKVDGKWEFIESLELTREEIPVTMPSEGQWCVINSEAVLRYTEEGALELLCEVTGMP
jgi:hypothetical protein